MELLSIIIISSLIFFLYKRKNVEGFAIIMAIRKFAQIINKIRKIMVKMKKRIFDKIRKIHKKVKKLRKANKKVKKIEKKIKKKAKQASDDAEKDVENEIDSEGKKQKKPSGIKGLFFPITSVILTSTALAEKGVGGLKDIVSKAPQKIVDTLLSPFKNIKEHFEIKNGPFYMIGSTMLVIMLSQLSETIASVLGLADNLIITGLFNFIFTFIISAGLLIFNYKSKCNIKTPKQAIKSLSPKKIGIKSALVTFQIIIMLYKVAGQIFRIIDFFASKIPFLSAILKVKNPLALGIIHLIITIINPIPDCNEVYEK